MPYRSRYGHQIWCGPFVDPLHSCRLAFRGLWFPWFSVYGLHCVCEPSKACGMPYTNKPDQVPISVPGIPVQVNNGDPPMVPTGTSTRSCTVPALTHVVWIWNRGIWNDQMTKTYQVTTTGTVYQVYTGMVSLNRFWGAEYR